MQDDSLHMPYGTKAWIEVVRTFHQCNHYMNRRLKELGLSVAQHELLVNVEREGRLNQKQLASRLLVVKSNVAALVKKLEQRGLIIREAGESDGRTRWIQLSEMGRTLVAQSLQIQRETIELMTSPLSKGDIDAMEVLVRKVRMALQEA